MNADLNTVIQGKNAEIKKLKENHDTVTKKKDNEIESLKRKKQL